MRLHSESSCLIRQSWTPSGGLDGARQIVLGRGHRGQGTEGRVTGLAETAGSPLPCTSACLPVRPASISCPGCWLPWGLSPLWPWTLSLVTSGIIYVLVSCRANMEITSSKGQVFLVETCSGMSVQEGRASGSSDEADRLAALHPTQRRM